jgi:hypothetical protein
MIRALLFLVATFDVCHRWFSTLKKTGILHISRQMQCGTVIEKAMATNSGQT